MNTKIDKRTGIDTTKVNGAVVDQYLAKLGLPIDGVELIRVTRLHDVMQLVPNKGAKLGNCSVCRGKSHIDLPCCPFCGDGDIEDDPETNAARETKPEDAVIAELKKLIEKQREVDEKASTAKAEADKAKTTSATPVTAPSPVAGQSLVVVPANVLQSKRAAKKAAKDKPDASSDQQSLAIAGSTKVAFSVADLDRSCEEIRTYLNRAGENIYEASIVMFRVFEDKLWMQRRNDDNEPKYANFGEWAEAEMPFNKSYAYELTNLPKYFTREQAAKIGSTKLTLSLRIDEEERRRLLESGDLEKMSVREVKAAITQNPATQPKNPERTEQAVSGTVLTPGTKPSKPKGTTTISKSNTITPAPVPRVIASPLPAPRRPETITLVTCAIPTQIEFDLVVNEENKTRPPRKARDLSDDPVAFITCANGAKLRIAFMKDAEGNLRGMLTAESSHLVSAPTDDDEGDE